MAQFKYTARNSSGELASGVLEAQDASSVAQILSGRNFTPIEISEAKVEQADKSHKVNIFTPQVTLDDLVIFSRQMHSLVKAGIPILRAVKGLADTTSSKRMEVALIDLTDQLERGRTLSSALNQHPDVFSRLFISIVHAIQNSNSSSFLAFDNKKYIFK